MFVRFPALEIVVPTRVLNGLAQDIDRVSEAALTEIGPDIVDIYQQEIAAVHAVDTGHFMNTVKVRRQSWHEREIGSQASYSGVVEHGWTERARGQDSYPGRFPAKRAVARLGPSIQSAFSHQLMR